MSHPTALHRALPDSPALAPWGFAAALATLGTTTLWQASIGINFSVWILCVVIALLTVMRDRFGVVSPPSLAASAWAVILAFGTAITTDSLRIGLLLLASLSLLAIALVSANRWSLDSLQLRTALPAPFVALGLVAASALREAIGTARGTRSPAFASAVRSAIITIPLVTALVFLLAEADPIFATARDGLMHGVPRELIAKSAFFALLLGVTLGAFGDVTRSARRNVAHTPSDSLEIGAIERRVLMSALASIVWLFVASSGLSLTHNPAAVTGSGITYAEYVHRGFAELSVAATIVIGAVLVTRRSWMRSDAWARGIAAAAILGETGMIAIGFMRIVRYEQAYGFTQQRLYAQAYIVVLACMSVLLLGETLRRSTSSHFSYHSASAALLVFTVCVFCNTESWIVQHNIERYRETGQLDTSYITYQMSDDAIPALVENIKWLHQPERATVRSFIRNKDIELQRAADSKWYAWNYRARAGRRAAHMFRANDLSGPPLRESGNE
ncbi:MAG: DUF4173 domain-containing protein [Gemmatimonadaceae bacterium]